MDIQKNRWWDWLTVILFVSIQMIAAYRLTDTKWTDHLELVTTLTAIALLLGLLLGLSRFSARLVRIFSVVYSTFFIGWQFLLLTPTSYRWVERVWLLGDRVWKSVSLFLTNQPLNDSILFLIFIAVIFWLTAFIGAYRLVRLGKPWGALIVIAALMLTMDVYHQALAKRGFSTALVAILALVLIARVYYLHQAQRWQEEHVAMDTDTGVNMVRGVIILAFALVILAWNTPEVAAAIFPNTPERQALIENWQNFRQRLQNATAPLRGSVPVEVEYYGDTFGLGSGSILTDATVFTVTPNQSQRLGVPFYWRIRSYDTYADGIWKSSILTQQTYRTNDKFISYPQFNSRTVMEFRFRPARSLTILYAPGLTMQINHAASLTVTSSDDQVQDVVAVSVDPMISAGSVYEISASLAAPTIKQLEEAGQDYPDWVTETYLQLPDDLPPSISQLAQEITAGAETPYQKVTLVTNWLRENIEYQPVLPEIPQGQDPIEWMLFTQKQAFCNYYATAEVLMLRSLGIPARWVVGYNQGELDDSTDEAYYRVRDKNRHAWPEVFFPGLGWIEFEPTASEPVIDRPSGETSANPGQPNNQGALMLEDDLPERPEATEAPPAATKPGTYANQILFSALALFLLLVIAGLLVWWLPYLNRKKRDPEKALAVQLEKSIRARGWRVPRMISEWAFYARLTEMERTFYWMRVVNRLAGIRPAPGLTPAEQLNKVAAVLPDAAEAAGLYRTEYQREMYSPYPSNLQTAQNAMRTMLFAAFAYRWNLLRLKIVSVFGGEAS
jgi:transglutaminase-like putative cysteine protease